MTSARFGDARLISIDVLRGVAMALVLMTHGPLSWSITPARPHEVVRDAAFPPAAEAVMGFGGFGVNLFLIVSGFCIHMAWARLGDRTRGVDFFRFWRRRLIRLYPPYAAAVACSVLGLVIVYGVLPGIREWPALVGYDSSAGFALDLAVLALMLQNVTDAGARIGNSPLWTLALEEQLYLLYFPLLLLRRRFGWSTTIAIVVGVTLAWRAAPFFVPTLPTTWTFLGPSRWAEWALGALAVEGALGIAALPRWTRSLGVGTILLLVAIAINFPLPEVTSSPLRLISDLSFGLAFFVLLNTLVTTEGRSSARQLLEHLPVRAFAAFGLISYSVYLTHVPAVVAAKQIVLRLGLSAGGAEAVVMVALRVGAAILVGFVFYRLVEAPAVRASRRYGRRVITPPAGDAVTASAS